jgi:hypothetical protein
MARTAHGLDIDHSDTPIRLFESDFLEWFTHVSPIAVVVIWTPVVGFFIVRGVIDNGAGRWWSTVLAAFLVGLVVWTFTEYSNALARCLGRASVSGSAARHGKLTHR